MDRNKFLKTTCCLGIGSCAGFELLLNGNSTTPGNTIREKTEGIPVVPLDAGQIQRLLRFVDSLQDEAVKKLIFERLGLEHTTNDKYLVYLNNYKKNLKGYFDMVNSNQATYWEKLEYDPETSIITVTGRIVDKCVCPFAQCEDPPKSLCNYCCKNFQKAMFEILLDKKVEVRIDEAFLLGNNRCSTTIFVDGRLPLERI